MTREEDTVEELYLIRVLKSKKKEEDFSRKTAHITVNTEMSAHAIEQFGQLLIMLASKL